MRRTDGKTRPSKKAARFFMVAFFGLIGLTVILLVTLWIRSFGWSAYGQTEIPDPDDPKSTIVIREDKYVQMTIDKKKVKDPDDSRLKTASADTRTFSTRDYTNFAKAKTPDGYTGPWMPLSGLTLWFWGFKLKWCMKPAAEAAYHAGWMIACIIMAVICLIMWRVMKKVSIRQARERRSTGGDREFSTRRGGLRGWLKRLNPFANTGDRNDWGGPQPEGSRRPRRRRRRRFHRRRRRQRRPADDD